MIVLPGCLGKEYDRPVDPTLPNVETTTRHPGYADLPGDWSNLAGSFLLHKVTTRVEYRNGTPGAWTPITAQCGQLWFWGWHPENRTLVVSSSKPLHPSDPGPLTAVWLNDQVYGPNCHVWGFFGINEDFVDRKIPLLPYTVAPDDAWVALNITWNRRSIDPPFHEVTINHNTFEGKEEGNATWRGRHPQYPEIEYRATAQFEFLAEVPYANVIRA